jgi:sugar phosphate isomerase/epimerase
VFAGGFVNSLHVGATADTGHWLRSGLDPVACLKILQGHITSAHPTE